MRSVDSLPTRRTCWRHPTSHNLALEGPPPTDRSAPTFTPFLKTKKCQPRRRGKHGTNWAEIRPFSGLGDLVACDRAAQFGIESASTAMCGATTSMVSVVGPDFQLRNQKSALR